MIRTCRFCKRPYWRYRRDYPPRFFCSLPCFEASRVEGDGVAIPQLPAVILAAMREHRLQVHGTTSPLCWYSCKRCEQLEGDYAASLQWHYNCTAEIATVGGRQRV